MSLVTLTMRTQTVTLRKAVIDDVGLIVELMARDQLRASVESSAVADRGPYLKAFEAIDADPVLAARVRADLGRSRTPRQIAGRLRLEANDTTVETMRKSPDAQGLTVSHEVFLSIDLRLAQGRAGQVQNPAPVQACEA